MQLKDLSSNEISLIKRISQLIIDSVTTNYSKGSPQFDKFIEEFGDLLEDANQFGIAQAITDDILLFEEIKNSPELMTKLTKANLETVKIMLKEIFHPEYKPKTRKKLLKRVEALLLLSNQKPNLN